MEVDYSLPCLNILVRRVSLDLGRLVGVEILDESCGGGRAEQGLTSEGQHIRHSYSCRDSHCQVDVY